MPVLITSAYHDKLREDGCYDTLLTNIDGNTISASYGIDGVTRTFDFMYFMSPDNRPCTCLELVDDHSIYDMYMVFKYLSLNGPDMFDSLGLYSMNQSLINIAIDELPFDYLMSATNEYWVYIGGYYGLCRSRSIPLKLTKEQMAIHLQEVIEKNIGMHHEIVPLELSNKTAESMQWVFHDRVYDGSFVFDSIQYHIRITLTKVNELNVAHINSSIGGSSITCGDDIVHVINAWSITKNEMCAKLIEIDHQYQILVFVGLWDEMPEYISRLLVDTIHDIGVLTGSNNTYIPGDIIKNAGVRASHEVTDEDFTILNTISMEYSQKFKDYVDELRTNTGY